MDLRRSKVYYAKELRDRNGKLKDPRRVIILEPEHKPGIARCVVCATIRQSSHDDLTEVVIPHGVNKPHPQTSFTQPTVAVCDWLADVPYENFMPESDHGYVKPHVLSEIIQTVNLLDERAQGVDPQ